MTTGISYQHHFNQEQQTQLGQVYRLILSWRQERLVSQAQQVMRKTSAPDGRDKNRPMQEDAESSEA